MQWSIKQIFLIVVVQNNEEDLYQRIKLLLSNPEKLKYYRKQAVLRGKTFSTSNTTKVVEDMLQTL